MNVLLILIYLAYCSTAHLIHCALTQGAMPHHPCILYLHSQAQCHIRAHSSHCFGYYGKKVMFTKYDTDLPCKNMTYISTIGMGDGVSHPLNIMQNLSKFCFVFSFIPTLFASHKKNIAVWIQRQQFLSTTYYPVERVVAIDGRSWISTTLKRNILKKCCINQSFWRWKSMNFDGQIWTR